MKQIILDTETTGLEPEKGHRIIEIGCIELIDRRYTGNNFHRYINPQRKVEVGTLIIHGITDEFLADKPSFSIIVDDFLNFIDGAELIAHNAPFDVNFINHELKLLSNDAKLLDTYVTIFDTLSLARKTFPGQHNNLDALCKRYKIDLSSRKLHGALLDAQLLAEVYLLMTCGQSSLFSDDALMLHEASNNKTTTRKINKNRTQLSVTYADSSAIAAHKNFLSIIKKNTGKCLWENE